MIMKIKGYCEHYLECPDMKILVISPPAFSEPFSESYFEAFFGDDVVPRSRELSKWYGLGAQQHSYFFLDATSQIEAGSADHLHLSPEGHAQLAQLVKDKVLEIF
jgi:lysophospholipase L1-like esterase